MKELLTKSSINTKSWGRGKAKSLDRLLHEIIVGETTLSIGPDKKLIRDVKVSNVTVTYRDLKLAEERQVFEDGRVRVRSLSASIAEKVYPDESPKEATKRCLKEELDLEPTSELKKVNTKVNTVVSPSYPGLRSRYTVHSYELTLDPEYFHPEGSVKKNVQDGITAFFKWRKG